MEIFLTAFQISTTKVLHCFHYGIVIYEETSVVIFDWYFVCKKQLTQFHELGVELIDGFD